MKSDDFSDATLLLAGHGSTINEDSSGPVLQHSRALAGRGIFAKVLPGFLKQEPLIEQVLASADTPRVFVVPMFISEGYFSTQILPARLGFTTAESGELQRVKKRGDTTCYFCAPVGTHGSMAEVILARAREVVAAFPFPRAPRPAETTLFIAGHGTEKDPNSRKAIEKQVEVIRARGIYAGVFPAFMEEDPRIAGSFQQAATKYIVMVPFFISDGLHAAEDIPVLLGEPKNLVEDRLKAGKPTWRNPTERNGKLLWYSKSIGSDPGISEVILQRVREAADADAFPELG
jgi:sirohydrochlorin cobaltochelatase